MRLRGDENIFKGVYQGSRAYLQPKRILILGESHYGTQSSTQYVIAQKYLANPGQTSYRFFERIVQSFGFEKGDRKRFWSKVWFGNYVDEPCGVGDAQARNAIGTNAAKYNQELFAFIEENHIDLVFCFSRLVYGNLPRLRPENGDCESCEMEDRTHYLMKCIYGPGNRSDLGMVLHNSVTVYGLKHPSRGFSVHRYRNALAGILDA